MPADYLCMQSVFKICIWNLLPYYANSAHFIIKYNFHSVVFVLQYASVEVLLCRRVTVHTLPGNTHHWPHATGNFRAAGKKVSCYFLVIKYTACSETLFRTMQYGFPKYS